MKKILLFNFELLIFSSEGKTNLGIYQGLTDEFFQDDDSQNIDIAYGIFSIPLHAPWGMCAKLYPIICQDVTY